MKKILILLIFIFIVSCTSNTIFEKPKNLIPKDSMSLLIQEMIIATSAKFTKNKNQQKNINYMPFVYDKFNIDSTRFNASNTYYMSKIDIYQEILEKAKARIDKKTTLFEKTKSRSDSILRDSIAKIRKAQMRLDSLRIVKKLDSLSLKKEPHNLLFKIKTNPFNDSINIPKFNINCFLNFF